MPDTAIRYTEIKPAAACRYDNVALGEIMLRLDPYDVPTPLARTMRTFQGGGETNVACGLSYVFGLRAAVLTALVDDAIGRSIVNQLRTLGVDTSQIVWFNTRGDGRYSTDQKGTLHNGMMVTFVGKGLIPSDTLYYRAHTPVRELAPGDIDWENLFAIQGVRVFSTGGIYSLLSPTSWQVALEGMQAAAAHGTFVTADLNYRSKVEPNRSRAREINRRLAPQIGFLVGNDSDLADALGYETSGIKESAGFAPWFEAYQQTVRRVAQDFPNLSLIGTQWRGATNADLISWGAVLYDVAADTFYSAPLRHDVPIADRTGGGDSFASGVLAALLKGQDLQTAVEWGAAHGILVQETPGDTTMVDEKLLLAEVKRARSKGGVKALR